MQLVLLYQCKLQSTLLFPYACSANCSLVLLSAHLTETLKTEQHSYKDKIEDAESTFVSRSYKDTYRKYGIPLSIP